MYIMRVFLKDDMLNNDQWCINVHTISAILLSSRLLSHAHTAPLVVNSIVGCLMLISTYRDILLVHSKHGLNTLCRLYNFATIMSGCCNVTFMHVLHTKVYHCYSLVVRAHNINYYNTCTVTSHSLCTVKIPSIELILSSGRSALHTYWPVWVVLIAPST